MDIVALEVGACDEQGILEIYLILFVVRVVHELAVAGNSELSGLVGGVCYLCRPYLVCSALGNVVGHLGLYALVLGCDNGVSGTVAALALEFIEGLAYGRPGSGPVLAGLLIAQVNVASGGVVCNAVEAVADNTSVSAALYEAVAAGVVGNDSAVLGVAEVVCPCGRCVRTGDDILLAEFVEMSVVHWYSSIYSSARGGVFTIPAVFQPCLYYNIKRLHFKGGVLHKVFITFLCIVTAAAVLQGKFAEIRHEERIPSAPHCVFISSCECRGSSLRSVSR